MVNETTKEKILKHLKAADERLSGEELSRRLGVSRVAVWKQIKSLIGAGYPIESGSRGYRLQSGGDLLSDLEFAKEEGILFYRELESTMDEAVRQIRRPSLESRTFIILADHQSAGIGRNRENWNSPTGGIYLTFVIRRTMDKNELDGLKKKGILTVLRVLASLTGREISYRLSGDILLESRKAGGLLEEYQVRGNDLLWYALGLGLHLNDRPAEDSPMTSVLSGTGINAGRTDTVRRLKENWEELLGQPLERIEKELSEYRRIDKE